VTAVTIILVRRRPYLLVGWLWFLGTLVPVIGIVQVGGQALADRYTYIPLIGLFIMAAWVAVDLVDVHPRSRPVIVAAFGLILVVLSGRTYMQTRYWHDSITLFQHSLEVNEANSTAHNNLGTALMAQRRFEEAATHFTRSLEIAPSNIDALNNLGAVWLLSGRPDKAAEAFTQVLGVTPQDPTVYSNLGVALLEQGKRPEAKAQFLRALELDPGCSKARDALRIMGEPLP
jgi:tetratricopeptide (TPR) repeat protein